MIRSAPPAVRSWLRRGHQALGHDYKDGTCTRCGDKQPGVNTGDNSTMTMWTMSAVMALAGAAVLVLRSRKEKYEG